MEDTFVGRRLSILRQTQLTLRDYSSSSETAFKVNICAPTVHEQLFTYDQLLIPYIRSQITEPSLTPSRHLNRPDRKDRSQFGQSKYVDTLLSRRRGGFFIECGAADGESLSNSLFFELERNWTGILIEANPDFHRSILSKKRHAYVLQACLSTQKRHRKLRMQPAGIYGGLVDTMQRSHLKYIGAGKRDEITVNCFPLNAIMAAINVSRVDYLSLDVEGAELEILRTIEWTQLKIDVITVEYLILHNPAGTLRKLKQLRQYFNDTGIYEERGILPRRGLLHRSNDVVYMRTS